MKPYSVKKIRGGLFEVTVRDYIQGENVILGEFASELEAYQVLVDWATQELRNTGKQPLAAHRKLEYIGRLTKNYKDWL